MNSVAESLSTRACYVVDEDNFYYYCTPRYGNFTDDAPARYRSLFGTNTDNFNDRSITKADWDDGGFSSTQLCELNVSSMEFALLYIGTNLVCNMVDIGVHCMDRYRSE